MTTYATLKANTETGELSGMFTTLTFAKQLRFVPVRSTKQSAPVYRVMCNDAEIGAVWEKKARDTGQIYHSVMLDGPELAQPIHMAMFPAKDQPNTFELTWNRMKKAAAPQQGSVDHYAGLSE
jgi:uncharacterized protein (DUF736 family)